MNITNVQNFILVLGNQMHFNKKNCWQLQVTQVSNVAHVPLVCYFSLFTTSYALIQFCNFLKL